MPAFVPAYSKRGRQAVNVRNKSTNPWNRYPESSTKQDSKLWAEYDSCGRKTIGRVRSEK